MSCQFLTDNDYQHLANLTATKGPMRTFHAVRALCGRSNYIALPMHKIAAEAGVSKRTVQRHTAALAARGAILKAADQPSAKRQRPNRIFLAGRPDPQAVDAAYQRRRAAHVTSAPARAARDRQHAAKAAARRRNEAEQIAAGIVREYFAAIVTADDRASSLQRLDAAAGPAPMGDRTATASDRLIYSDRLLTSGIVRRAHHRFKRE